MASPRGGGRPPDTRATGQVLAYKRKDGLTSWYLRVRAYGSRYRINLGTELDGWTQARARIELQNVLAKIQAGLWEPPAPQATTLDDPTFHQFASRWLESSPGTWCKGFALISSVKAWAAQAAMSSLTSFSSSVLAVRADRFS
jgi:hypothetical protein